MTNTQNTFKISQLRDIENLDGNDLFLVSDHTGNNFYTRKLSASVLFNKIQDNVITHITTNETFLDKLAEKIVKISGNEISSAITPNIQDTVIEQATPIVSAQAIPLVSSEAIPLISSDLLELTIQDIISNDVISSAIICVDTAIGYGVHSAISNQIDDAITENIVSDVVNEISVNNYLSTCVVTTITDNRDDIWDVLTDGEHDDENEINAGGA